MTDKACALCSKSHATASDRLECRAHPPRQDVAPLAQFPMVRSADYCHEFEPLAAIEPAPRARRARTDNAELPL